MNGYAIRLTPRAQRQLKKLPAPAQRQIKPAIDELEDNPFPEGRVKLRGVKKGQPARWRIRVGNFRVVYTINEGARAVEVLEVQDRKDVYR